MTHIWLTWGENLPALAEEKRKNTETDLCQKSHAQMLTAPHALYSSTAT